MCRRWACGAGAAVGGGRGARRGARRGEGEAGGAGAAWGPGGTTGAPMPWDAGSADLWQGSLLLGALQDDTPQRSGRPPSISLACTHRHPLPRPCPAATQATKLLQASILKIEQGDLELDGLAGAPIDEVRRGA
jgi:hypothetical protein